MGQDNVNTKRRTGQHMDFEDRQLLEYEIINNQKRAKASRLSQKEIASRLGVSQATISRELKRGAVCQMDNLLRTYTSYSATVAQIDYDKKASRKGPDLKIGKNQKLAEYIERKILGEKDPDEVDETEDKPIRYSPDAIVMELDKTDGWATFGAERISTRTLYNYIDDGLFLRVSNQDLPRHGKTQKRCYKRVRRSHNNSGGRSIKERPQEADDRSEVGHWEIDCIESGKMHRDGRIAAKKGRACLLTLIERSSRQVIMLKLPGQTQASVKRAMNGLERTLGAKAFRETFKSITSDNGSEFLDWQTLEESVYNKKARTTIYYAHPNCSWERGSNENANGFIRYFIPKGVMIAEYTKKEIENLAKQINKYPRRLLDGLSADEFALSACQYSA